MISLNEIDKSLSKEIFISGVQDNSKKIKSGDLFIAIDGDKKNGEEFIGESIESGAIAVVTSNKKIKNSKLTVPIIFDISPRKRLSKISKLFYPNSPKIICAVTGTNGKTSTVDYLYQIWTHLGLEAASIGTLGVKSKTLNCITENTTPGPIELHKMLNKLSLLGVSHLALEVSSHAINQNRIDSIDLHSACFTNLSQDHLDYHKSLKNYSDVKFKLFDELLPSKNASIVCIDSDQGGKFSKKIKSLNRKVFDVGEGAEFINIVSVEEYSNGKKVEILFKNKTYIIFLEVNAHFEVLNILCAAGLAIESGCNYSKVFSSLEFIKPVKGRLEKISTNDSSNIIIDYAHTPDALSHVLESIKKETSGKIVLVFGCGGDRDKSKRILMGGVAQKFCEEIIITNDNPRNEDPSNIANQIIKGCPKAIISLDRFSAIKLGISKIRNQDTLLIAGKGHEELQIIGGQELPFSDHKVVEEILRTTHG